MKLFNKKKEPSITMKRIPGSKCPKCGEETVSRIQGIEDISLWCTTCGWSQINYDTINVRPSHPVHHVKGCYARTASWGMFLILVLVAYVAFNSGKIDKNLLKSPLPNSTAAYLHKITQSKEAVNQAIKEVSQQHSLSNSNRNTENYRDVILQGITACEQSQLELQAENPPRELQELYNISKQYIMNSQIALKHYLNFTHSQNNSDIIIANDYLSQANIDQQNYRVKLIGFLEEYNFKYEILQDGSVRYWYKDGLFHHSPSW